MSLSQIKIVDGWQTNLLLFYWGGQQMSIYCIIQEHILSERTMLQSTFALHCHVTLLRLVFYQQ